MEIEEGGILVMSIVVIGIILVIAIGIGSVTNINIQSNYANLVGHITVSQPDVIVQNSITGNIIKSYNAISNTDFGRGVALLEAVSNEVSYENIFLKSETYNINQSQIYQNGPGGSGTVTNVNIYGAGKYQTVVTANAEYGPNWSPGYNSTTSDLSMYGFDWFGNNNYGNSTLRNVFMQGLIDAVYLYRQPDDSITNGGNMYFENDTLTSGYDTLNLFNSQGTFYLLDDSFTVNVHTPAEHAGNPGCFLRAMANLGGQRAGPFNFYQTDYIVNTTSQIIPGLCGQAASIYAAVYINGIGSESTIDFFGGKITNLATGENDIYLSSGLTTSINSTFSYNSLAVYGGGTISNTLTTFSNDIGPVNYQKSPMTPPGLSSSQLANLSSQTNTITNTQGSAAAFLFWIFWMVVIITIVMMIVAKTKMN